MALGSLAAHLSVRGFSSIGASLKRKKLVKKINSGNGNKEDYVWLSGYYINKKEFNKAESFAKKALELSPNYEESEDLLYSIYLFKKEYLQAIDILNIKIERYPEIGILYYNVGYCYFKLDDTEKANSFLEQAIKYDSSLSGEKYT